MSASSFARVPSLIDYLAASILRCTRCRVMPLMLTCPLLLGIVATAHGQYAQPQGSAVYSSEGIAIVDDSQQGGMTGLPIGVQGSWPEDPNFLGTCPPGLNEGWPSYPANYYDTWGWDILPDGLIYRSYMAGPRESKMQLNMMQEMGTKETYWDVILGGRRGLLRYGNSDPLNPEGWQLDIEGGTILRLNLDHERDLDTSDFRFGVPLTYGWGQWQYKLGYYHLSSHLGDELIVRTPGATRDNYVRDAVVFGVAYNPTPAWRLYGEAAYAFFTAGGAEPWEFQFGVEYAQPGATDIYGTPFFATNGHLREELDFGGDYVVQAGWLWRGASGSTFRTGFQFLTGHSNLYQFYDESEEQYGWAIWYDF